jgi:hypothetical protein
MEDRISAFADKINIIEKSKEIHENRVKRYEQNV